MKISVQTLLRLFSMKQSKKRGGLYVGDFVFILTIKQFLGTKIYIFFHSSTVWHTKETKYMTEEGKKGGRDGQRDGGGKESGKGDGRNKEGRKAGRQNTSYELSHERRHCCSKCVMKLKLQLHPTYCQWLHSSKLVVFSIMLKVHIWFAIISVKLVHIILS